MLRERNTALKDNYMPGSFSDKEDEPTPQPSLSKKGTCGPRREVDKDNILLSTVTRRRERTKKGQKYEEEKSKKQARDSKHSRSEVYTILIAASNK